MVLLDVLKKLKEPSESQTARQYAQKARYGESVMRLRGGCCSTRAIDKSTPFDGIPLRAEGGTESGGRSGDRGEGGGEPGGDDGADPASAPPPEHNLGHTHHSLGGTHDHGLLHHDHSSSSAFGGGGAFTSSSAGGMGGGMGGM